MPFNLATVHDRIAKAIPDRTSLIFRNRKFSYGELNERTNRFANLLMDIGVRTPQDRQTLPGYKSGQDHVALYLQNGNEYLESMVGAMKARAAPINVNYRYVADELRYLLTNSETRFLVYHARYAPVVATILTDIPHQKALIQVADESNSPLLDGAIDYEAGLMAASPQTPDCDPSPDDLYILYTGGTTGLPKGVLWRQADILASALGARRKDGEIMTDLEEFADRAKTIKVQTYLPTPPFMHGTAQWISLSAWHNGHTIVIQDEVHRYNPDDLLRNIDRHQINIISLVGDAFANPFLTALNAGQYSTASLTHILNGGAGMSPSVKGALLDRLDSIKIVDTIGSSEAGPLARQTASSTSSPRTPPARIGDSFVLTADKSRRLEAGSEELGWLAKTGHVPLGYLNDPEKTADTFPTIDGVRYSVPGDRVRLLHDGQLDFYGRDSSSINSGGEKIFAEEVEQALARHPSVADVLVSWRPSDRWGQEVVALVATAAGETIDPKQLTDHAGQYLARYKLPKAIIIVDKVQRHDNGKPDYVWAKSMATKAA